AAERGEVGRRRRVGEDQRRVLRRDQELMAIGRKAFARLHGRDLLVLVVVDVVGAFREATEAGALPPGEDGLAVIGLGAEVGGLLAGRDLVEPNDVAVLVEDLGAVGVGRRAAEGGDEEIALAEVAAVGEDRHGWGSGGGVGGGGARERASGGECGDRRGGGRGARRAQAPTRLATRNRRG